MTTVIWKFLLSPDKPCRIAMPRFAAANFVAAQGDDLFLWAVCPNVEREEREMRDFYVFGTGHPIDPPKPGLRYIGSALMNGGALVWHVFEKPVERNIGELLLESIGAES